MVVNQLYSRQQRSEVKVDDGEALKLWMRVKPSDETALNLIRSESILKGGTVESMELIYFSFASFKNFLLEQLIFKREKGKCEGLSIHNSNSNGQKFCLESFWVVVRMSEEKVGFNGSTFLDWFTSDQIVVLVAK